MFDGLEMARLRRLESRTASFENPKGEKGRGGMAASPLGPGRKGRPWQSLAAGEEVELMTADGPGQVRHIWMTMPANAEHLRGLVLRAWWDGMEHPSVECPVGDFFGMAHARTQHFVNAVQAMQEGAGLNAYFPMPFAKGTRITLRNDAPTPTEMVYYYVDYTLGDEVDAETGRFHACFRRENPTTRTKDFHILPERHGRGRYLGATVGVRVIDPIWWGEGEPKIYLDGDTDWPTIVGTGSEDYIGSAWGLGQHFALYGGAPFVAAVPPDYKLVSWYRFHIPDPVYFQSSIRVDMQQIGLVLDEQGENMLSERQDDWCAAAFWYQDGNEPLPPLPDYEARIADLGPVEGETKFVRIGM